MNYYKKNSEKKVAIGPIGPIRPKSVLAKIPHFIRKKFTIPRVRVILRKFHILVEFRKKKIFVEFFQIPRFSFTQDQGLAAGRSGI